MRRPTGTCIDPPFEVKFTMKSRVQAVLVLLSFALSRGLHAQANQDSALSLQGFTGILNTPDAHVQREGTIDVLYSNQRESIARQTPPVPRWQDNYLFSVGMLKFLEVGGRLTNTNGTATTSFGIRDLAVNWKASSAPLTSHFRFSPTLAVGMEDAGGAGHHFATTYVAGSADPVGWLRVSAGYGHGPDRMHGAFGGGELRLHPWVSLLADYDTQNPTIGGRLTSPTLPYIPARLTATISAPFQRPEGLALAGGIIVPLNYKEWTHHREFAPVTAKMPSKDTLWGVLTAKRMKSAPAVAPPRPNYTAVPAPAPVAPAALVSAPVPVVTASTVEPISLDVLRERLIRAGFVNVRVGLQGRTTLVVEYENIRYNHNELDAIGVVAGIASQAAGLGPEDLRLVVKRKGLALLQIETQLLPLRDWLSGNGPQPALSISQTTSEYGTSFVIGNDNPGRLKPSLMVYPSLITLIGTENGLFDYQLSIRPELQVPLWAGATAVARADLPVSWSPNLDKGQVYASTRTPERLDRLMLFQALPLAPGLVANLGAGKISATDTGTLNEISWTSGGGMNRVKAIQSWGRSSGTNNNTLLGSYRYFLARHDLAFEATGGRFFGQDSGMLVSMQRFFGDASVSLYFKDTVTPDDHKRWLQGGIQIELPLTPRRDMRPRPLQIRGHEDWGYAQETGIASSKTQNENYVRPGLGVIPEPTQMLAVYFYDRERLNSDYIQSHADRIRESWRYFRDDLYPHH